MVKVRKGAASVAGYFARTPTPARKLLREMRDAIRSVVPRETVEVISYRMPAFKDGPGIRPKRTMRPSKATLP
jgi:uncharacterized protein YdhG (YjbR/CyaY superfamily)